MSRPAPYRLAKTPRKECGGLITAGNEGGYVTDTDIKTAG